jgi:NAD(P)H-dependent FMN reductase
MNPKTVTWIARSLDRIAKNGALANRIADELARHGQVSKQTIDRVDELYDEVFWTKPADEQET